MKGKRFNLVISIIFLLTFAITAFTSCYHRKPQTIISYNSNSSSADNQNSESSLVDVFNRPSEDAKPWVYWYWIDANVTEEGITADLQAMAAQGIGGVYLFSIGMEKENLVVKEPANPLTDNWWEMIKHSAKEADRLGLKIALNACDGWATAAAPEITPELSMQELVWSDTIVTGGIIFDGILGQPTTRLGYYRDLAVWAIPLPVRIDFSQEGTEPEITTNIPGVDISQLKKMDGSIVTDKPGWIQYAFAKPFTCRSVTIYGIPGNLYNAFNTQLEISLDGKTWEYSGRLNSPFLGGVQSHLSTSFSIKPIEGRFFRFTFNNENFDPKTWKMKFSTGWLPGYYQPELGISKIIIDENPVIEGWQHKNGSVWRQSKSLNSENIPESLCVKIADMINLTDKMQPDGRLKWEAPKGNTWLLQRFGYITTGSKNGPASSGQGLEADKFNSAVVDIQYNSWFGKAYSKLKQDNTEKVLVSNHIDSWECKSQNWSPVFRDEFTKRRGYDPVKYLPAMTGIPVESAEVSERFLNDIRITISELICNNFLESYVKLIHSNKARFSAESIAPTVMCDGMAHYGKADVPMGEFWLQSPLHDKPNDILDAIHAAHIYGKKIIQAEAFTQIGINWNEDPYFLKTLGDHNFARGINRLVLHVWAHKSSKGEPGITLSYIGTEFSRTQPWWEASKAWFDYLTRTQALLQEGNPVVDVLYYTGENMPVRAFMPDDLVPELPDGYTYNSINRDALLNQAGAEDGHIVLPGGITCRVLVLPDDSRMSPEVAEKIAQMSQEGVIVIGFKPDRSWSLSGYPQCDKEVQRIVRKGWKDVRGNITLNKVYEEIRLQPDVVFENTDMSFIWKEEQQYKTQTFVWSHRITKNADIYFLSNQEYKSREVVVKFRVTGKVPELWNAETGQIRELPNWSVNNGQTSIPLKFGPAESYFIVFRKDGNPKNLPESNFSEYTDIMTIEGPWKIYFQKQRGAPDSVEMKELVSLHFCSEQGVKYFSGTATYKNTFQLKNSRQSRIFIDLGEVANIADIYLNGKEVAILWKPPFRTELTGLLNSGDNILEIHVSNTWRNRLVGDVNKAQNEKVTYLPDFPVQRLRELPLINSGLLGPVKIQEIKKGAIYN